MTLRVATHPGNFHADDVFAVATLALAHGDVQVVRTRDRAVQDDADVRVDVGERHDAAAGDFDHHQKGGAGERDNGIRYASFGLVWREHGEALAGSADAAAAIDERLVQGVDANDTGQNLTQSLIGDIRPMSVSGLVAALNPSWDEELSSEEEDARFGQAVELATGILDRELAGARAFARAEGLVRDAIAAADAAGEPRLVELPSNLPWRHGVVTGAPEALYVIYPKSDGWGLQAVPRELGSFANRRDLPDAWGGLSDAALQEATGVDDAIFAHPNRFYASAGSREGILELAVKALAEG